MITITKILCPVDFLPASAAAVHYAIDLAAKYKARIHLLHVITPIAGGTYEYVVDTTEIMKSMQASTMQEMNDLVAKLKQRGVVADSEVRIGDVDDEIQQAIAVIKPDLVVMGTHGRTGAQRWYMGSTTKNLLCQSLVPLVIITPRRREPDRTQSRLRADFTTLAALMP
jgi:nucleotide-binding universal stress UspA family protein